MKVGDKLLCKRLVDDQISGWYKCFTLNKEYMIQKTKKNTIGVIDDTNEMFNFRINKKFNDGDMTYWVYDHFYSLKEVRQMKLEELDLSR